MSMSDYDILKLMLPRIPTGKHTRVHIMLGWAALVLFPIWLPLALGYFFFWCLCMLGEGAQEFLLKGAHWLTERAEEKNRGPEGASRDADSEDRQDKDDSDEGGSTAEGEDADTEHADDGDRADDGVREATPTRPRPTRRNDS